VEVLLTQEVYDFINQHIQPEMLVMLPALLFLGWMMKQTPHMPDWLIPYINTVFGVVGGVAISSSIAQGAIQGFLVSAMSVLMFNFYKQWPKKKDKV